MTTRDYRLKSRTMGQTSPPGLGHLVVAHVVGSSVADVGCGSGVTGYLLRSAWQFTGSWYQEGITTPTRLVGIDWSASTIDALGRFNPYDELLLAGAAGIPLPDAAVDTALSMENLEHLLPVEVPVALDELARIASRRVVISTPAPWAATNVGFLTTELAEAQADDEPMGHAEYLTLLGYLHKSSVTPEQMIRAGFECGFNRLGAPDVTQYGSIIYTADPAKVNTKNLGSVVGVAWDGYPEPDDGDWGSRYIEAVRDSLTMATPRSAPPRRRVSAVAKALRSSITTD